MLFKRSKKDLVFEQVKPLPLSILTSPPETQYVPFGRQQQSTRAPITSPDRTRPFHRPIRTDSVGLRRKGSAPSISSAYSRKAATLADTNGAVPKSPSLHNIKRKQQQPSFRILVCGSRGVGKTGICKLILEHIDLANNSEDIRSRIQQFGSLQSRHEEISADFVSVEGDKIALTIIDTVGFDLRSEYEAELQISELSRIPETRFWQSLEEETQIVRNRLNDGHIHLVIYVLGQDSFVMENPKAASVLRKPLRKRSQSNPAMSKAREAQRSPTQQRPNGHATTYRLPNGSSIDMESSEEMTTQEDSLVQPQLVLHPLDLKCMQKLGKRVNVLPVIGRADEMTTAQAVQKRQAVCRAFEEHGLTFGVLQRQEAPTDQRETGLPKSASAPDFRSDPDTPIVRTRSRSISRKRRTLLQLDELRAPPPVSNDVHDRLPFCLMTPEMWPDPDATDRRFVRAYPWSTINVLDPQVSDFGIFFQTILHTHIHAFRAETKTLYEDFRAEKRLLARHIGANVK